MESGGRETGIGVTDAEKGGGGKVARDPLQFEGKGEDGAGSEHEQGIRHREVGGLELNESSQKKYEILKLEQKDKTRSYCS